MHVTLKWNDEQASSEKEKETYEVENLKKKSRISARYLVKRLSSSMCRVVTRIEFSH